MNKITAVIITKNEERNLARCLQSLQGVADEILIIDSFSKDRTLAIAGEYGARVIQKEWMGYGPTKNFGNKNAKYDYILSLDADEALSEELAASLIAEKKQLIRPAYAMKRLLNYCGHWIRHGGFYPDRKIRLFDRRQLKWSDDPVHETLLPGTKALRKEIKELNGDLYHYSYHSVSDHMDRINRYSGLAAQKLISRRYLCWHMLLNPSWRFFSSFVLKGGFLDGYPGYLLCRIQAFEVFLKYAKARQLRKSGHF